jgi:hypothetical protein
MAPDSLLSISAASLVEDVLRQHSKKLCDRDLASRKAEETGTFFFHAHPLSKNLTMLKMTKCNILTSYISVVFIKFFPASPLA